MIEHNMHAIEGDTAMHKRKHTGQCYEVVIPYNSHVTIYLHHYINSIRLGISLTIIICQLGNKGFYYWFKKKPIPW